MYFNPYIMPLLAAGALMLAIAYWVWNYRSERWAKTFAVLALFCAFYALTYAMEISSVSLDILFFWLKVEYIAVAFIPAILLLFAYDYSGRAGRSYLKISVVLAIIPFLTLIVLYTNQYHYLFYQTFRIDHGGLFPVITFERGPWYWVHSAYIIFSILLANIFFVLMWFNANQVFRKQISLILLASLIPWLGFIFYLTRVISWNIDLNPYFLSSCSLMIFWGLIRYRLLDMLPIARARLFEELPDGALIIDNSLRIVDLNTSAQRYLQISADAIGKPVSDVLLKWPQLAAKIKPHKKRSNIEMRNYLSEEVCWLKIDFIPLQDKSNRLYGQMIILRETTDRKLFEEKLEHLATTDDLTGLWNRRYFLEVAEKEMIRAKRYNNKFSMIMIDIDRFKKINDSFGHSAGDKTLKHLALLLKSRLREVDVAARLGGEEFGILLPNTDLNSAFNLAEDLRESISSTPVIYDDKEIYTTVSIGVTGYHSSISEVDDILKEADKALYRAKEKGRNCTVKKEE